MSRSNDQNRATLIEERANAYRAEYCRIAQVICKRGGGQSDLAAAFGVDADEIDAWKQLYPEFARACEDGNHDLVGRIERALFDCCLGYEYDEEQLFKIKSEIIRTTTKKKVPPDPKACELLLKLNRENKLLKADDRAAEILKFFSGKKFKTFQPVEDPDLVDTRSSSSRT